jgi:4-amino-4-deoxy-L-arabinose transferase-like glycosyltransferase
MKLEALARGLGLGADDPRPHPLASWCVAVMLGLYGLSFVIFYPNALTNSDESGYMHQVQMMLRGTFSVVQENPLDGTTEAVRPGDYPLGTALLMAPLVGRFGWRASFVVPALSLLLTVLFTARWLRDEGRSPVFALLVLGFVPSLVMGRVAMSDVPSAAVVVLGMWLFWRGLDRGTGWWLASGFIAGASLLMRATNPVAFVPLFAGTVLRREWRCWALIVGGLSGIATYLGVTRWYFGDAFFLRSIYYPDIATFHERFVIYGFGLLILIPGGFAFTLAYRGRRRPEVIASLLLFVGFFLGQEFSSVGTSFYRRIVLALRYLIPILPLVAFATAEAAPRLWRDALARRMPEQRVRLERIMGGALATALAGLAIACVVVHPAFNAWSSTQAEMRSQVRRLVPVDAVYITNFDATRKFFPLPDQKYRPVDRSTVEPDEVGSLVERYGRVFIVFLDRTDTESWRRDAQATADFIAALGSAPELLFDRQVTSTDRLRIWRIGRAG